MKLSVCCITYKHEKFIAKAIEGMLMQQTNFPFEVIIGEDGSPDKTRKICERLQEQYPDRIKLLPSTGNTGMMPNFIKTLRACSGDYVAICEGDDYWVDEKKLQKQVDFLDSHPGYAICYHRVYELLGNAPLQLEAINGSNEEKDYSINNLASENFIHTVSVVFRNHLFQEFPSWFPESPVGDYVLHMLNARFGKIHYLPEPMAVYRRHKQGAWGLRKAEENSLNFIKVIDYLISEFQGEVKDILIRQKAAVYSQLATIKYYDRNVDKAKQYLEDAFRLDGTLRERWLNKDYPSLIHNLFNSRRYKTIDKLASYLNKLS